MDTSRLPVAPLPVVVVQLTIGSSAVYDAPGHTYDDPDWVYDQPSTTRFFSDIEYGDGGTNWHEARVIGDIGYSREGTPSLQGQRRSGAGGLGNIELINDDGALDALCTGQQWDASVAVFEVDQDQPMSAATQIAAATVTRIEAQGERTVRIITGDVLALLDVPLQQSLYASGDGVATLIGRPRPVAIGNPLSCPIVLVDAVDYDYDCHDSPSHTIVTVRDNGYPLALGTDPGDGYKIATDPGINGITLLQQPIGRVVADISATTASAVPVIAAAEGDFDSDLTDWTVTTSTGGIGSTGTAAATWDGGGAAALSADKLADGPFDGLGAYARLQFPTGLTAGQRYDWSLSIDMTVSGTVGHGLVQVFFEPDSLAPAEYVTLVLSYVSGATTPSGSFTAPAAGKFSIMCSAAYGGACEALIDAVRLDAVSAGGTVAEVVELLLARAGIGADQIDLESLAALDAARPWPVSYWADGAERIGDVLAQVLDSVFGWVYTNAAGQISVGFLQPPEAEDAAVAEITETELAGEVEIEPDLAPGLSTTLSGARNWYKYGESELADAISDADRALLTADFRIRRTATNPVGVELGPRAGAQISEMSASGIPTLLDDATNIQTGADYLADLYPAGSPRRFYKIPCFRSRTQLAALNPGVKVTLTYDRFGCDAGRALRFLRIDGRAGDDLVILRCWGSAVDE